MLKINSMQNVYMGDIVCKDSTTQKACVKIFYVNNVSIQGSIFKSNNLRRQFVLIIYIGIYKKI